MVTGIGLLKAWERVTGRIKKLRDDLRSSLRALTADAREGFTGKRDIEVHSADAAFTAVGTLSATAVGRIGLKPRLRATKC